MLLLLQTACICASSALACFALQLEQVLERAVGLGRVPQRVAGLAALHEVVHEQAAAMHQQQQTPCQCTLMPH